MTKIVIDEFRNIIVLIIFELVLALPYLPKRRNFPLKLILGICFCLGVAVCYYFVYQFIRDRNIDVVVILVSAFWYIFIALLTGAMIAFCFEINKTEFVWILITAYALKHFVYVAVVEIVFFGMLEKSTEIIWQTLTSLGVAVVLGGVEYAVFVPNKYGGNRLNLNNDRLNFLALLVFFVVFFASTFVNQANARQKTINYLSMISDIVNCVFVVVVQYYSLRNARIRYDKARLEILLENERKRYETFKNSVDYINIKCHDLKKEIKAMRDTGTFTSDKLNEISESVAVYESFADTGNTVLDTILTDVNFTCVENGISFSCIADASAFNNMKGEEIYRLFGNILDNAVEHVKKISDENKKFIRLFVKSEGSLKIIHEENCLEGELVFSGAIPLTTKKDKINHGFGMQSVRQIVKEYDGEMQVFAENGLFKVDIVLSK